MEKKLPKIKELEDAHLKIHDLELDLKRATDSDKAIRFKAGQILLKAIDKVKESGGYLPQLNLGPRKTDDEYFISDDAAI